MHLHVSHGTEILTIEHLAIAGPLFHITTLLVTLVLSILTFRTSDLLLHSTREGIQTRMTIRERGMK
jgi:hypothetical protein